MNQLTPVALLIIISSLIDPLQAFLVVSEYIERTPTFTLVVQDILSLVLRGIHLNKG